MAPADNFNRADETPLGGNWSTHAGVGNGCGLFSNQVIGNNAGLACSFWNATTFPDNQYSQIVVVGTGSVGPAVRIRTSVQYDAYVVYMPVSGTVTIYRIQNGTLTSLSTPNFAFAAGDVIRLTVVGTLLTVYKNGVSQGSVTDTVLATGSAGVFGDSASVVADNWSGGSIFFVQGGSAVTPPNTHANSVTMTIPATIANDDLVVMVENGDDPATTITVLSVTATGATFSRQAGIGNTVGTHYANAECWVAHMVPAGITSVTVTWTGLTVGVVTIGEYIGVQALGQQTTAIGTAANPSLSLTTQDSDNVMVAGFCDEATAQGAFTKLTGILRFEQGALGNGAPDVRGALVDNDTAAPASVTCAVTHGASGGAWAAVALELRTTQGDGGAAQQGIGASSRQYYGLTAGRIR